MNIEQERMMWAIYAQLLSLATVDIILAQDHSPEAYAFMDKVEPDVQFAELVLGEDAFYEAWDI